MSKVGKGKDVNTPREGCHFPTVVGRTDGTSWIEEQMINELGESLRFEGGRWDDLPVDESGDPVGSGHGPTEC